MRWASESYEARKDRLKLWHPWFAWFPVRIGERRVWLETVQRRGGYNGCVFRPSWCWSYALHPGKPCR